MNVGVHNTHCCKRHGCKYANEDCPVYHGLLPGVEQCEQGSDMEESCVPLDVELAKREKHYAGARSDVARHRGEVARATARLEEAIRMEARLEQWVYEAKQEIEREGS